MTRNAIRPSLFGTTEMNLQPQSQSTIYPSLFGTTFISLFGTPQINSQQQLEIETQRRSEELAKEDEIKLRKFDDNIRHRATLVGYSYTNKSFL